jgi:acetaldehyde dehydrogenase
MSGAALVFVDAQHYGKLCREMEFAVQGKIPVAILGSGIIGTDLLYKVRRSANMSCGCFVGRRESSEGMRRARELGVPVSSGEAGFLLANPDLYEIVFDATSAEAHKAHSHRFTAIGKMVFDLTPSHSGTPVVPTINAERLFLSRDVSLVSCGGQAALPVIHAVARQCAEIEYIEMVNTSASKSAGLATRLNMDEYLETTEAAIAEFSGCGRVKCLGLLNPAMPPVHMRVTTTLLVRRYDKERVTRAVRDAVAAVRRYVPGYTLVADPVYGDGKITILLRVSGRGDYLAEYAGNLDIINAAAVHLGDLYSQRLRQQQSCAKAQLETA